MKIKCNKVISYVTGKDLGNEDSWFKKGNEYVVLLAQISNKTGIEVYVQSEDDNEPIFTKLEGFEIISNKTPSTWITVIEKLPRDETLVTMLPESWNYDSFFEDLEDEEPEAIRLFNLEAQKIYEEEESL